MFKPRSVLTKRPAAGAGADSDAGNAVVSAGADASSAQMQQPPKRSRESKWGPPVTSGALSEDKCIIAALQDKYEPPSAPLGSEAMCAATNTAHFPLLPLQSQPVEHAGTKENSLGGENAIEAESMFELLPSKRPVPKLKVSVSLASITSLQSGITQKRDGVESEPHAWEVRSRSAADGRVLEEAGVDGEEVALDRQHEHSTASYHGRDGYFAGGVAAVIAGRYRVMAVLGRGVFASVARCLDLASGADVALKILRRASNAGAVSDALSISGVTETATLRALQSHANGSGSGHIVRLLDTFEFEGHACLVLERMHTSLRAICRSTSASGKGSLASSESGASIGPPGGGMFTKHVLSIARQVLEGLKHMHSMGYVHADLKPDNILLDQTLTCAKICDFGTCFHISHGAPGAELSSSGEVPRHGYVAARFYRAPEVALGFGRISSAIDIWALCVTIAEMCSGSILFKGSNNNELIWDMMTHLGPIARNLASSSRHAEDFLEGSDTSASPDYYLLRKEPPKDSLSDASKAQCPSISAEAMPRPNRADALHRLLRRMLPPSIREADANAMSSSAKKEWAKIASIRDFFANKGMVYDPNQRCSAEKALADLALLEGHVK